MSRRPALPVLAFALFGAGASLQTGGCAEAREEAPSLEALQLEPSTSSEALIPLPNHVAFDAEKAALGERLFADRRLSGDGRVSCTDCHLLSRGGANGERRSSLSARAKSVPVNVPSFFNVAFDARYAWDGRFKTLEQQLDFTLVSPAAMKGSFEQAALALRGDEALQRAFADAYAEASTADNVRDALVSYCRSATTPNARFDRFLRGELQLSEQEARGYESFRDFGCISCHQGVNLGGNMYQRLGVMKPYFTDERPAQPTDFGRYNQSHDERDRFVFRVPSLRNVARTAPYFHDGSAATLDEAVLAMARHQLGRELSTDRTAEIVAFLQSLTGEYRGKPL